MLKKWEGHSLCSLICKWKFNDRQHRSYWQYHCSPQENGLVLKIVEWLQDYLSCEKKFNGQEEGFVRTAPSHQNLAKKIGNCVKNIWTQKTLDSPKFLIVRPIVESKEISAEDWQEYQLDVGFLLYLVKYSWPDIASTTRKLLKANECPNPAAFKELPHVIKHVLDTRNFGSR